MAEEDTGKLSTGAYAGITATLGASTIGFIIKAFNDAVDYARAYAQNEVMKTRDSIRFAPVLESAIEGPIEYAMSRFARPRGTREKGASHVHIGHGKIETKMADAPVASTLYKGAKTFFSIGTNMASEKQPGYTAAAGGMLVVGGVVLVGFFKSAAPIAASAATIGSQAISSSIEVLAGRVKGKRDGKNFDINVRKLIKHALNNGVTTVDAGGVETKYNFADKDNLTDQEILIIKRLIFAAFLDDDFRLFKEEDTENSINGKEISTKLAGIRFSVQDHKLIAKEGVVEHLLNQLAYYMKQHQRKEVNDAEFSQTPMGINLLNQLNILNRVVGAGADLAEGATLSSAIAEVQRNLADYVTKVDRNEEQLAEFAERLQELKEAIQTAQEERKTLADDVARHDDSLRAAEEGLAIVTKGAGEHHVATTTRLESLETSRDAALAKIGGISSQLDHLKGAVESLNKSKGAPNP